jgi:hypothetical protein
MSFPLGLSRVTSSLLRRVSQVPRLIYPRAPSPLTPEGPTAAFTPCFTAGGRLHHSQAGWPPSLCVTRPHRVRLRYGSRVCLARLRQRDCSLSRLLGYLLNGQFTRWTPFSSQDQPGLSWRILRPQSLRELCVANVGFLLRPRRFLVKPRPSVVVWLRRPAALC